MISIDLQLSCAGLRGTARATQGLVHLKTSIGVRDRDEKEIGGERGRKGDVGGNIGRNIGSDDGNCSQPPQSPATPGPPPYTPPGTDEKHLVNTSDGNGNGDVKKKSPARINIILRLGEIEFFQVSVIDGFETTIFLFFVSI